ALPPNAYGDGASLALFLADPARSGGPDPDSLRDRFQLTPAEAALAIQLAEGAALVDAARALDIAHNTARAHLRAIFAKTGTHRQVQLVHLLRTSTGGFTV
ncbi:helix-turn-helix transcriptional regulator, partial [Sphingobium jiangsuense]